MVVWAMASPGCYPPGGGEFAATSVRRVAATGAARAFVRNVPGTRAEVPIEPESRASPVGTLVRGVMVTRTRPVALIAALATMFLSAIVVGSLGDRGDAPQTRGAAPARQASVDSDVTEVRAIPASRDDRADTLRGRARLVAVGVGDAAAVAPVPWRAVSGDAAWQATRRACRVRCARAPPGSR